MYGKLRHSMLVQLPNEYYRLLWYWALQYECSPQYIINVLIAHFGGLNPRTAIGHGPLKDRWKGNNTDNYLEGTLKRDLESLLLPPPKNISELAEHPYRTKRTYQDLLTFKHWNKDDPILEEELITIKNYMSSFCLSEIIGAHIDYIKKIHDENGRETK